MTTDDVTPDIAPTELQPGDEGWQPFKDKYTTRYEGQYRHLVSTLAPDHSSSLCGRPARQLTGGLFVAYECEDCARLAKRGNLVPPISDDCATCGGRIYLTRNLLGERYRLNEWTHLLQSDWIDNVHPAVPKTATLNGDYDNG